jgi:transposase
MVSLYVFQEIRNLMGQGKSQATVAKELGINPKTVSKYVRSNTPPKYKARTQSTRQDPLKGFEIKVRGWLIRTPTLTGQEIFELLIPEGYKGSERTINRRMKTLRKPEEQERFFEQEYTPGEQSQFDFKEKVILPFIDGDRLVNLHFGTLPYSDTCLVRGYPFKNYECFIDGIHSFFESIGGMTENIRFDNLSPCVKKVLKGDKRLYTNDFKRAIKYYGFGPLPCRPAKGSDKGDVERDIRTFSNRVKNRVSHEGLVFRDWDHLNNWLATFMKQRQSPHSLGKLQEEKKKLKTLPIREEGILCKIQIGPATSYGTVRFADSTYSVPDSMIGQGCRTVIGPYEVRIGFLAIHSSKEIIIHPRKQKGEDSLLLEHVLPSLIRKPHAMVRWAHRGVLFPKPICKKFYQKLKKIDSHAAEREYLRAINLIHHTTLCEIITGMELIIETASETLFDDLRVLLLGERRPRDVIEITNRLNQSPLKPELSQYDSLIPKTGVNSE